MAEREDITEGEMLVKLNALKHLLAIQKVRFTIGQIEDLLEQEKPVVVFSCYKEVVNQLMEQFPEAGKITGDCTEKERQQAVDDFQDGKLKLIICNIVAAGVGITLTASDTVIFNDFDWTPANHLQAEDRIHRIGQNKKANVFYIYAENADIDARLEEIIQEKLANINTIVDGQKTESVFAELMDKMNLKKKKETKKEPA